MELKVVNLSKRYSDKLVVENLNLKIQSGEILGLLGPNGAGKTTFFYLMVGLIQPDSGEIYIDDLNVTKDDISIRSKYGLSYLPQESSIFKGLSVKKNILSALEQRSELSKQEKLEELNRILDDLKLHHLSDNKGITLSGGERRRVEIARSLASNPHFLFLDEPFAGIDPIAISELKRLILKLNGMGIGILISDHNVRETMKICKKVIILNEGKIISEGTPEKVSANEVVKEIYLGSDFNSN